MEENIRFAGDLAGRDADVARLLELAGLDGTYAERDSSKLSVGEQQRSMLARALALEPKVLLLDEPTSALDPATTAAIEETLAGLRARLEVDVVWVSHDIAQAERVSGWLIRVDEGHAIEQGPTVELLGSGAG